MHENTLLLICDVWDNHYCKDLRQRTESLAERINGFAKTLRQQDGRILHCPSDTVDSYYSDYPQRQRMEKYQGKEPNISQEMREVIFPLDTTFTNGCPDIPQCQIHTRSTKQHKGIEIHEEDFISDNGQEIHSFIIDRGIKQVLMAGTALNMCVLGRPFGVQALVEYGVPVKIVSDLVETAYSPTEPPYITQEQAKWFALGYIEAKWCPITTVWEETRELPKERNMKIHSNIPGPLLARLGREHHLESFIETGTAYGDTTELAAIMFDRVWSCDIDPRLVQKSQERLKDYPGVTISNEPSPQFLKRIKPEITRPALYWLDAHWCGGPTKPLKECPLLEEIAAIGSFRPANSFPQFNGHSVILIDDINLIENPPKPPHDPKQWPTMNGLREALDNWGQLYTFEWYDGPVSRILIVTSRQPI